MGATTNYDYSQPIATLLRQGTSAAHEKAEKSQGAAWMLRGELDKDEYIRFLMMLWHVYNELENALNEHSSTPAIAGTYNPTLLARSPALSADISHLLQVSEADWPSHPIHTELLLSPPEPFTAYTTRLRALATNAETPGSAGLLAHAYVRYLGDLSGGQVLRRRIAKAYGLDGEADDAPGVNFYDFGPLEGGRRRGTQGELRRVKEWYRDGMNDGVGDDEDLKRALVVEANIAFDLNTGLFSSLRAPSSTASASTRSALASHRDPLAVRPPLGDPLLSPTSSSPATSFMSSRNTTEADAYSPLMTGPSSRAGKEVSVSKELPIIIEQGDGPGEPGSLGDKTYKLSSVISFIAAVCLAHYILITGGWVGTGGWVSQFFPE